MFGLIEPYSGHFYECEWREWDNINKTYKPPIIFRIKGNAQIGVSTGIKETIQVMENNRPVLKETFKVHAVEQHKYKPKDKVRLLLDNTDYIIAKVSDDVNHPNAMGNLMFQNANVPKVLYLGDS